MAEIGNIKIANEVVGIIAGIAATEVEGVYAMSGGVAEGISEILGRKNLSKGVKVEVGEKECTVEVYLVVEYGVKIPDVALKVQDKVMKAISGMTGLKVVEVNVYIQGIHIPKEEKEPQINIKMNEH